MHRCEASTHQACGNCSIQVPVT